MKLLIRENDNNLAWKEVGYKNGSFFDTTNEKCKYSNDRIYAIKDDDRNEIVICSACGKEVRNASAAMDAHRNSIVQTPNAQAVYEPEPKIWESSKIALVIGKC
jgi:hypothetical protein